MRRLRTLSPYLLYLALALPGLGKAFHVDDAYVLTWAAHVRGQPLRPVDFRMDWHGVHVPVGVLANPPLHAYVLAALTAAVGEREAPLHAAMLGFGLLGLLAAGTVAARAGVDPVAARLLMAASPSLTVMSQTVMPDVAAFGLGCLGLALGLQAVDRERPLVALAAGCALAAACLTRYTALGLAAALAAWALGGRRRPRAAAVLALAVVAAAMVGWVAVLRGSGGPTHLSGLLTPGAAAGPGALGAKLAATAAQFGGALVLAPLLLVFRPRSRRGRVAAFTLALAAGTAVALAAPPALPAPSLVLLAALAACGTLALAWILARVVAWVARWPSAGAERDIEPALCLWVLAPLLVPLTYQHVAVKYQLLVLPAVVILLLRRPGWNRHLTAAGVAGGCVLSLACAEADRRHADVARRAAREVAAPLVARGGVVWYAPEWGYRIYLSRAGARTLTRASRPAAGDLLLASDTTPPFELPRLMGLQVEPRARHVFTTRVPLVLMNADHGAGFYSSVWGWLPYAWAQTPVTMDALTVYEVTDRTAVSAVPAPGAARP